MPSSRVFKLGTASATDLLAGLGKPGHPEDSSEAERMESDALSGSSAARTTAEKAGQPAVDGLLNRIKRREAKVGILGLGYVGLPLALAVARAGFPTAGVDVDQKNVADILGARVSSDASAEELQAILASQKLRVGTDHSVLGDCDIAIVCVPTPLSRNHEPDLSHVTAAARAIADHMFGPNAGERARLVIVESTSYPGTTEEVVRPVLESSGRTVGNDFFLAYSPERVDPGNTKYVLSNTPKVVGGSTETCRELAVTFYDEFVEKVVPVSSTQAAEMTKLLENIFRCVNIALVNEMAILCDRMGLDVWEVVDAAATKPFGFMRFYPGPGLGGHCIPVDPFYLSWKAREHDFHTEFIELAGKVNENMPYYVVEKISRALDSQKKSLNGAKILTLGVAYKPDIADTRESPALKVMELLERRGAEVLYSDPYVSRLEVGGLTYRSTELSKSLVASVDCVAILTNHSGLDYEMVAREAPLIVDTRNTINHRFDHIWRL